MLRRKTDAVTLLLLCVSMILTGIVLGVYYTEHYRKGPVRVTYTTDMPPQGMHSAAPITIIPGGKLEQVISLIDQSYIEPIGRDSILELAIPALLHSLDPHSEYIPAHERQFFDEPLQGKFDGIGIVFNMATDTVIVLNVIPSGPSRKAGVMGGDRIIKVNDTIISGCKMPQNTVMKRLRGPRGSQVKLSVERQGIADLVDIVVTRDEIPLRSVEACVMLTKDIGFIRLSQFAVTSHTEVMRALEKLRNQGMTRLIFDLRNNGGGLLDQAILIANEFLPERTVIVSTEDRNKHRFMQYSNGRGRYSDLQTVVLIDETSASASEILAGALQDNDRGTIIGRRSFGKGLVQMQQPFDDGSAMRLTIARYLTPTGRSIQKPYKAGEKVDYDMELIKRYEHNEYFSADSIHFADSLRYTTPKGKVVYGGGGIMPDIFMPLDTLNMTPYFNEVSGRNILYRYTIDYADRHRTALAAANNIADLERLFAADTRLLDNFVAYAERQGVAPVKSDIEKSRHIIEAQLKAYIARNSDLEDGAFYYFIRPIDRTVLRAIEELHSSTD